VYVRGLLFVGDNSLTCVDIIIVTAIQTTTTSFYCIICLYQRSY